MAGRRSNEAAEASPHEDAPRENELHPVGRLFASGPIDARRGPRLPCRATGGTGASLDLRPTGPVWPSGSRPHCTMGAFSRDWQKETRRAGSTAGGYLIKWTPSRGGANTPPMYSSGKTRLLTSRLDYTTNVTTGTPESAIQQAAETSFSQLNGHAPRRMSGADRRSTIAPCPVGCAHAGVIKRTPMRGESKGSYGRGDTRG